MQIHKTCSFLKDADGYNCTFSIISAMGAFQIVWECTDFVELKTIQGGFDKLTDALGMEVGKCGAKIGVETRLKSVHVAFDHR